MRSLTSKKKEDTTKGRATYRYREYDIRCYAYWC